MQLPPMSTLLPMTLSMEHLLSEIKPKEVVASLMSAMSKDPYYHGFHRMVLALMDTINRAPSLLASNVFTNNANYAPLAA